MIENVKSWLTDLEKTANKNKVKAKESGMNFIWRSNQKNKDIKEKFSLEGEKLGTIGTRYSSRSSGKSSGGEWLYDFTLREFDENNRLISIPLVAEIELSDSKMKGLIYDFNKLLQADSRNKVFIFQQKYESDFLSIHNEIEHSLTAYKHKSDSTYLIACWITSEYRFIFASHEIKSSK